jgi:gliding motility-associated-like protein
MKKIIMRTSIQKYKSAFFLLFLLISGVAKGQQIESIEYTVYDPQYIFACNKATPIDLFKVAHMYVSPNNGYWGDVRGVPYNGKGDATIKERKYTTGNIFNTPTMEADTGMYRFYFYFTSAKSYCGIEKGTRFVLNLYIGTAGCLTVISGELDNTHTFCYGSSVDISSRGRHEFTAPISIEVLLLTWSNEPEKWKKDRSMNSDWVDIEVYSDREHHNYIGNGDMLVDLTPTSGSYDTTFYVIIHNQKDFSDSINIRVYPESKVEVTYSPDDVKTSNKEYDINDRITIRVDTSEYEFKYYTFLLNNKNLNKYYLGSDSTKNEITLNALVFSGSEDFINVVVTDKNNCIARFSDNIIVNVPFPTVFTPDGDGVNDVFYGGEKFRNREFHLEVSNRWGNLLYSGESGWDGTYRGNKVPPGTYLYVLRLKMEDGTTRIIENTVTLIRESR